jgi:hypothetical protein
MKNLDELFSVYVLVLHITEHEDGSHNVREEYVPDAPIRVPAGVPDRHKIAQDIAKTHKDKRHRLVAPFYDPCSLPLTPKAAKEWARHDCIIDLGRARRDEFQERQKLARA